MNREISEIALRIRELREVCGYTVEELAAELKLAPEVYREYEENGENIPISVIYEIANKFNVDFAEIVTGVDAKLNTFHIVRRGDGRCVDRYPGYQYEDLAFRYSRKIMQPLLVTLEPSEDVHEPVSHSGQEFNLVLEGTVALNFNDQELILNEGDSVYFNPTYPHAQSCVGDKKARFLTVITE